MLWTDDPLEFHMAVYRLPSCFTSWTASFCLVMFHLASQVLLSLTCRPYISSLDLCVKISPRFRVVLLLRPVLYHSPSLLPFYTRHLAIVVNTTIHSPWT